MEAYAMSDAIESGHFEVSEDGLQLVIEGDFVRTALKYLVIDANAEKFATSIRFNIGDQQASDMCESFYEIRHG